VDEVYKLRGDGRSVMIILDTDVCSVCCLENGKVLTLKVLRERNFAWTILTVRELFYAANRSEDSIGNRILAEKFLLTVRVLHPDMETARLVADIQAQLKRRGKAFSTDDITTYCISNGIWSPADHDTGEAILFHVKQSPARGTRVSSIMRRSG
jgi:predicted nucleic acid-binding protein